MGEEGGKKGGMEMKKGGRGEMEEGKEWKKKEEYLFNTAKNMSWASLTLRLSSMARMSLRPHGRYTLHHSPGQEVNPSDFQGMPQSIHLIKVCGL